MTKWANRPIALVSTGCSGEEAPAQAVICGNRKCANLGSTHIQCFCKAEKCNSATTYPNCHSPKPGNGVEGKAGSVFSVLVATIFAAIF